MKGPASEKVKLWSKSPLLSLFEVSVFNFFFFFSLKYIKVFIKVNGFHCDKRFPFRFLI